MPGRAGSSAHGKAGSRGCSPCVVGAEKSPRGEGPGLEARAQGAGPADMAGGQEGQEKLLL